MKIWRGYGSEHSMNLVLIGKFRNANDAEKTQNKINFFKENLGDKVEIGRERNRYGDELLKLLERANCYIISPSELEQFLYDFDIQVKGEKLILTTDESDISAFLKLMIDHGAKVEIFSAHDYPEENKED